MEVLRPQNTYELTVKTAMPKGVAVPRGRIALPFEPKERKRDKVIVFADGQNAQKAKKAGADIVGGPELIEPVSLEKCFASTFIPLNRQQLQVASGKLAANIILCTPSLIKIITPKLGRILGPRGMMPSERRGTVTDDIAGYLKRLHGSAEWKGDKAGTIRTAIGKVCLYGSGGLEHGAYHICSCIIP